MEEGSIDSQTNTVDQESTKDGGGDSCDVDSCRLRHCNLSESHGGWWWRGDILEKSGNLVETSCDHSSLIWDMEEAHTWREACVTYTVSMFACLLGVRTTTCLVLQLLLTR
jgi:hypothetical protein